jgi:hypothetical protein
MLGVVAVSLVAAFIIIEVEELGLPLRQLLTSLSEVAIRAMDWLVW